MLTRAEKGGEALAKPLILLGRRSGGEGGEGLVKPLKSLKANKEKQNPSLREGLTAPSVESLPALGIDHALR